MSYEHDAEFHANRMELINEQREYARIEHEQKMATAKSDRRERIATAAMQGILAYGREERESQKVADAAVRMADALIAELDKREAGNE